MGLRFVLNSLLLGVGLAMDAFSVSVANGMQETSMHIKKMLSVATTFAFFQFAMPLIGWICVHNIAKLFTAFQTFIPWIAFALLLYIGIHMIMEARKKENDVVIGKRTLLAQGVATSIDALSVGFTIADNPLSNAIVSSLLIGCVTFIICYIGVHLGKKTNHISNKSGIIGGAILVFIGIEILVKGIY